MKYFGDKSTLEGTHFEDLADLVGEAIEFALENSSIPRREGPETWTLRNKLANEFCEQWDKRTQESHGEKP